MLLTFAVTTPWSRLNDGRLITPSHGGCALFRFVTCALRCENNIVFFQKAVLSRMLCVVCWLFLATIRAHAVTCVVCEWITPLT